MHSQMLGVAIRAKTWKRGLDVSEIGLGCMGMSYAYGTSIRLRRNQTCPRHRASGLGFPNEIRLCYVPILF
jgi:hypothetical protein